MPRVFTHRPTKIGIVGNSGYGKSQFQIRYALASKARYKFVFDHKGEFEALAGAMPARTYDELDAAVETGWIVFNPHHLYRGELPEAFNFFCYYAWQASEQLGFTKQMFADELALLTEGNKPRPLLALMEDGRSVQLDCALTTHGLNSLHNRVRSQFNEIVSFYQSSEPALDVMRDEFGFNPDQIAGPKVNGVRVAGTGLQRGEFIWQTEDGRFRGGRVF